MEQTVNATPQEIAAVRAIYAWASNASDEQIRQHIVKERSTTLQRRLEPNPQEIAAFRAKHASARESSDEQIRRYIVNARINQLRLAQQQRAAQLRAQQQAQLQSVQGPAPQNQQDSVLPADSRLKGAEQDLEVTPQDIATYRAKYAGRPASDEQVRQYILNLRDARLKILSPQQLAHVRDIEVQLNQQGGTSQSIVPSTSEPATANLRNNIRTQQVQRFQQQGTQSLNVQTPSAPSQQGSLPQIEVPNTAQPPNSVPQNDIEINQLHNIQQQGPKLPNGQAPPAPGQQSSVPQTNVPNTSHPTTSDLNDQVRRCLEGRAPKAPNQQTSNSQVSTTKTSRQAIADWYEDDTPSFYVPPAATKAKKPTKPRTTKAAPKTAAKRKKRKRSDSDDEDSGMDLDSNTPPPLPPARKETPPPAKKQWQMPPKKTTLTRRGRHEAEPEDAPMSIELRDISCQDPECEGKHLHIKSHYAIIHASSKLVRKAGRIKLYVFDREAMTNPPYRHRMGMHEQCKDFDEGHMGAKLDKVDNFLANESFSSAREKDINEAKRIVYIETVELDPFLRGRGFSLNALRMALHDLELPEETVAMLQAGSVGDDPRDQVGAAERLTEHWGKIGFRPWSESDDCWLLLSIREHDQEVPYSKVANPKPEAVPETSTKKKTSRNQQASTAQTAATVQTASTV